MSPAASPPLYRLNPTDRIVIGKVEYRPHGTTATGYMLAQVHHPEIVEHFSVSDFANRFAKQNFRYYPRYFDERQAQVRGMVVEESLADLSEEERDQLIFKFHLCLMWQQSRAERDRVRAAAKRGAERPPKLSLTDRCLRPWLQTASVLVSAMGQRPATAAKSRIVRGAPCPRTFRQWLKQLRRADWNLQALRRDPRRTSGNFLAKVDSRASALMQTFGTRFASSTKPSARRLWEDMRLEANTMNKGLPFNERIRPVSWATFLGFVRSLPAFDVMARREGVEKAKRHFRIVGDGFFAAHIGEWGQMDDCKVAVVALLTASGAIARMTPAQIAQLTRARWWFGGTVDIATRYITSARVTLTPTNEHTLALLRMGLQDKTSWAQACGCQSDWCGATAFQSLSMDQGPAFVSGATGVALGEIGTHAVFGPAATPESHGHIERYFRTIQNQAIAYWSGRTFSNVVDCGDYDSRKFAAFAMEEVERLLIRWIVDVYHHQPHAGLGGETPHNAWLRLTREGIRRPPPDPTQRRRALGIKRVATLHAMGVRFLGIWYRAEEFKAYVLENGFVDVTVLLDPLDVGVVSVRLGDRWVNATARDAAFLGVTLAEWEAIAADMRRRFGEQASIVAPIVHAAISDIKASADAACVRAGHDSDDVIDQRIARVERDLLRISVQAHDPSDHVPTDILGRIVKPLVGHSSSRASESPAAVVPEDAFRPEDDDGWRF